MSLAVNQLIGFGCKRAAGGTCGCTPAYVTGDRTATITATTDLTIGGGTMSNLVDGGTAANSTDAIFFTAGQAVSGKYMRFDFGAAASVKITEAKWYMESGFSSHGSWKWQGSNDASSWTDIGSSFTLEYGVGGQVHTQLSGNASGYRYYQLVGVSGNMSTPAPYNTEIEFKSCNC
jgi:hypothetical protein